ncbi:MAG: universal stress protein [Candidatus Scalinduaceae bacterium]
MLKTILVPVDGSDTSLVAVEYAIELSRSFNSEIIGISIMDIKKLAGPFMRDLGTSIGGMVPYGDFQQKVRKLMEDIANAALDELEGKCNTANIPCVRGIKEGIVSKEIVKSAERCDMISMGMSGEHALWRDSLLGSNLESVARQTHKPIMVTPGKYKIITKMLIAYDGSPFSTKALHTGAEISQRMCLPLTVINACDDNGKGKEIMSEAIGYLRENNITHNTILESGDPVEVISELCEKDSYDLLVMGAYGHSKIRDLILGSTTIRLMRKANYPLLLCR